MRASELFNSANSRGIGGILKTYVGRIARQTRCVRYRPASPRRYLDLLRDLAENFRRHGFTRIFFLDGHDGNIIPGKQAVFELRQKYRDRMDLFLLFSSYWDLEKPRQMREGLLQTQMGRACEWEASMILSLAPHLVAGDLASLDSVPFDYGFDPAYRSWITKARSTAGHIGSPQYAAAPKDDRLFASFSAGAADFITSVAEWNGDC